MVARALYHGENIMKAAVANLYTKANEKYREYLDKDIGTIDPNEWGASPALEHLRSFFASKSKKKSRSKQSSSSNNANGASSSDGTNNNPQKIKLNYYNQLVGLWFEHGTNRETTLFDLMERRHFKYN